MTLTKTIDTSPIENLGRWNDTFSETDPEFFANLPRRIHREKPPWTGSQEEEVSYWNEWSQNSTIQLEYPEEIGKKIISLFEAAKEQVFEDGMESDFSKELVYLVERYGDAAVEVITGLIVTEQVNAEVASEALRWLGRMEHPVTHRSRLFLLERSLYCRSVYIKDGAILGLASLDDPHAISHLKRAIEREEYMELRADLEQVLIQLENTR